MRILSAILVCAYAMLVAHEAGHAPGNHAAYHSSAGHARDSDPHCSYSGKCGDEGREARCCADDHDHPRHMHVHVSLAARAERPRGTDAQDAAMAPLTHACCLLPIASRALLASAPAEAPPGAPAYLRNLSLRI